MPLQPVRDSKARLRSTYQLTVNLLHFIVPLAVVSGLCVAAVIGIAAINDSTTVDLFPNDRVLDVQITVAEEDWNRIRVQSRNFVEALQESRKFKPVKGPYTYVTARLTIDGIELPAFRGHIVNDVGFTAEERTADPARLLTAYNRAAATLNLLRAFTKGGFASLSSVHQWNREFVAASPAGQRYEALADEIDRAVQFMSACGINSDTLTDLRQVDFYTSHEALLLDYEEALTRQDSLTGDWYDCSAHMLWIGERTRQLDGAHVEFLRGVRNPLGCKVGPAASADEVLGLCEALNPDRQPGRLTLITRMGATKVVDLLPPLLSAVREASHPVVWVCDPMHGNTFTADDGRKTRHFEDVLAEVSGFFAAHRYVGTHPGGVHLELTGDDVTECLGGGAEVATSNLGDRYETMCDPRLNGSQSIELAFRLAELLRNGAR